MINEQLIIELIKDNNKDKALTMLYEELAPQMLALVFRYVGDEEVSKDIAQDVFIKVYDSFGKFEYRGLGKMVAWIKRICINMSLNYLKSYHVLNVELSDTIEESGIEDNESDIELLYDINLEDLTRLIANLPEGYRTILNLYAIEGYSHKEIATLLEIKEGSSASQYHKAKALLKRRILEWTKREK